MRGVSDDYARNVAKLWTVERRGPGVRGRVKTALCFIMSIFKKEMFSALLDKLLVPLFKSCIDFHLEELRYM